MVRSWSLAALAAVLVPSLASAQPHAGLLVSDAWLSQHLHDTDLVLLQVGEQATYDKGHIPGARFADWMTLHTMDSGPDALTLEMPPAPQLHDALERMGVSDRSHVVLYASDGYWSPSTRVFLTLDYAGLTNISYLDGGLKGWIAAGQPVSREAPAAARGSLAPLSLHPVIVDADFVGRHARTPGYVLVDARNREFFSGEKESGPRDHREKGHIPGAVNAPFDEFAADDGHLKPLAEITALFTKAGVKPGDTVIGYCHVGQQATAMLFAARLTGHPVLLYDGSFEDWARRGLPIEK